MPRRRSSSTSKRPPKSWWDDCVTGVKAACRRAYKKCARDPESVCGAQWYQKMGPAAKARAKRRHPN